MTVARQVQVLVLLPISIAVAHEHVQRRIPPQSIERLVAAHSVEHCQLVVPVPAIEEGAFLDMQQLRLQRVG